MKKVRQYQSTSIEICRNCGGTGKEKSILSLIKSECPICNGSGRVHKTKEITVTVESFKEEE